MHIPSDYIPVSYCTSCRISPGRQRISFIGGLQVIVVHDSIVLIHRRSKIAIRGRNIKRS